MLQLTNLDKIETLFDEMEPGHVAEEMFTPSMHQEAIQLDSDQLAPESDEEVDSIDDRALSDFTAFVGSDIPLPIAAIDVGVMDLGITRTGFVLAFKGAVVSQSLSGAHSVYKIGPRVKFITPDNRADILRYIGQELGNELMFVDYQPNGTMTIKAGAREPNQFKDRIRNFVERMLQLDVMKQLQNGLMLVDGTLTLRTYNTPQEFLERLGREGARRNSDIVGVSKKSRVTVQGVHLSTLLDSDGVQPGYRHVFSVDSEDADSAAAARNLGALFAVRFAPGGFTFRVDVARKSVLPSEDAVLQSLYANTQMTLGYPNLLRLAHIHAAFTKSEVVSLQVHAAHEYRMPMRAPEDLSVVFAPFRKGLGG